MTIRVYWITTLTTINSNNLDLTAFTSPDHVHSCHSTPRAISFNAQDLLQHGEKRNLVTMWTGASSRRPTDQPVSPRVTGKQEVGPFYMQCNVGKGFVVNFSYFDTSQVG